MKAGRNDPCPCGSGKKYKKCCLGKDLAPSQALYYQRLAEAHDRLVKKLLPYAERIFGEHAVGVAMDEFLLWPETEDEIEEEMFQRVQPIFWPWYLFNWEYDEIDAKIALPGPEGSTIAELYAEAHADKLDPLERRVIDGLNRKPYSFWEVLSVDKGQGMTLIDILQGIRIQVQERTGSQFVEAGDILFGRAVSVDGAGMIIGISPTVIPPGRKPEIIELRKDLKKSDGVITEESLYDWDTEIREFYFDIDRSLYSRPKLRNTDGDPLEFHKLVYEVTSADEAYKKLCSLCVTMTPDQLLKDAKKNRLGKIVSAEFTWDRHGHKGNSDLSNTVLGHIFIDGRRLTAEVNSAKRAAALRKKIDSLLDDSGRFKVDEIQDPDAKISRHEADQTLGKNTREHEELMQIPEVQAHMANMMDKHWETWVDKKIPALGNKTPRKAVQTPDGREAVEALLQDALGGQGQDPFMKEANRKGAQKVRELLGLAKDDE